MDLTFRIPSCFILKILLILSKFFFVSFRVISWINPFSLFPLPSPPNLILKNTGFRADNRGMARNASRRAKDSLS